MKKAMVLAGLILILMLGTAGCGSGPPDSQPPQDNGSPDVLNNTVGKEGFVRVSYDELPQEVKGWVDISREINLAQEKVFGNRRYILVTYGTKPTGGYTVEIKSVETSAAKISVEVKFTKPSKDQYVTQALTQPYDIVYIEPSHLPIEFFPVGDEYHIMTLTGIDQLAPIVASSDGIKVFAPAPGQTTGGEVRLSGVANVFEGTILIRIEDGKGETQLEAVLTMGGMGEWGYFEVPFTVPDVIPYESEYTLIVYTESAKDGEDENVIHIPLKK